MAGIGQKELKNARVQAGEGITPREKIGGKPGTYNINPSIGDDIDRAKLERIKGVGMKIRAIDIEKRAKSMDKSKITEI